jgi:hypothetical protein
MIKKAGERDLPSLRAKAAKGEGYLPLQERTS